MKRLLCACLLLLIFSGCAGKMPEIHGSVSLTEALMRLSPSVAHHEARRISEISHYVSRQLQERYGRTTAPWFHNFLVNAGMKDRGLCHEWTNDLYVHLKKLNPKEIAMLRVKARRGEYFEHTALVLFARGGNYKEGIIIDPWRRAEPLFWIPLWEDTGYGWEKL